MPRPHDATGRGDHDPEGDVKGRGQCVPECCVVAVGQDTEDDSPQPGEHPGEPGDRSDGEVGVASKPEPGSEGEPVGAPRGEPDDQLHDLGTVDTVRAVRRVRGDLGNRDQRSDQRRGQRGDQVDRPASRRQATGRGPGEGSAADRSEQQRPRGSGDDHQRQAAGEIRAATGQPVALLDQRLQHIDHANDRCDQGDEETDMERDRLDGLGGVHRIGRVCCHVLEAVHDGIDDSAEDEQREEAGDDFHQFSPSVQRASV